MPRPRHRLSARSSTWATVRSTPRLATALAAAGLVVTGPAVATAPAALAAPRSAPELEATRVALYDLVDAARADAGLPPLLRSPAVQDVAQRWSSRMAARGVLAHNTAVAAQLPPGWTVAGEDVGVTTSSSPAALQQAWLASPVHRANLLSPAFDQVGIGVAAGSHGRLFVTADFEAAPLPQR